MGRRRSDDAGTIEAAIELIQDASATLLRAMQLLEVHRPTSGLSDKVQKPKPKTLPLINARQLCVRLGISDATLWRLGKNGKLPKPVRVSSNRVAWREDDIDAWVASRISERDK